MAQSKNTSHTIRNWYALKVAGGKETLLAYLSFCPYKAPHTIRDTQLGALVSGLGLHRVFKLMY